MSTHALLIGLDGATFTILDRLLADGEMPHLATLAAGGARAALRTVVPPLTPPAWTSLLTGRGPGGHGIFDFFRLHGPGSHQIVLTTSLDLHSDTVATLANRAGLRATLLNFPATFPPPPLDGQVVAGWMPWRQLRLGCYPPQLFDELKQLPHFHPQILAMDMAMEAKATEGCAEDEQVRWVEAHARRDRGWADTALYLMRNRPTELFALLLDGPDKIQHLCWRDLDPALLEARPTARARQIRAACLDYFRQLDGIIGELVAAAGPEATVVIASDHGFTGTSEVFHINTWLEQAGYLTWASAFELGGPVQGTLGMNALARHTYWLDWEKTTAYVATPTSNGIHILIAGEEGKPGVRPDEYLAFRDRLAAELRAIRDPASGEPLVTGIWTREELFAGPSELLAPDLTLALRDGGLVSILPAPAHDGGRDPLRPREVVAGTHHPLGVLLARGPAIRPGAALDELSILDVAPLLLHSLGLPIPATIEGRVPAEIIDPAVQPRRPAKLPLAAAASPTAQPVASGPAYDEESEAIILERLRALGYVE